MRVSIFAGSTRRLPQLGDRECCVTWFEEGDTNKEQSTAKGQQAVQWNERLKELKKAKPLVDRAAEEAEAKLKQLTREAKDLAAKAKEIEDSVYDLKAVNPIKKSVE